MTSVQTWSDLIDFVGGDAKTRSILAGDGNAAEKATFSVAVTDAGGDQEARAATPAIAGARLTYAQSVTVASAGGNYTSISTAVIGITGATVSKRAKIEFRGVVDDQEVNFVEKGFIDIVGTGLRGKNVLRCYLPATSAPAVITTTQPLWIKTSGNHADYDVIGKNVRYALHMDRGPVGPGDVPIFNYLRNMRIVHEGNGEARAYRKSIGGDPNEIWASESALGGGLHSGQRLICENVDFISPSKPFSFHDNINFAEPAYVEVIGGSIIATNPDISTFTAAISGTTMTVSAVAAGRISVGMQLVGTGVTSGTMVVGRGTGKGGTGTYAIYPTQTASSTSIVGTNGTRDGHSINFQSQGSLKSNVFVFRDPMVKAPGNIDCGTGWLNPDPAKQPANRMSAFDVTIFGAGAGAKAACYTATQSGVTCLGLRSLAVAGSSVDVQGAGGVRLFGANPDYRLGDAGYAARVYSEKANTCPESTSNPSLMAAVAGQISLRAQLGNRTSSPETAFLFFDGSGGSVNIVLDENYAAMADDAAVLTALNAKLTAAGGGGRTFEIVNPYENVANWKRPDLETFVRNTGGVAILRGHGAQKGDRYGEVKIMTSATTATQFVGVALETIPVGQIGRVLRADKGTQINSKHLNFTGSLSGAAVGTLIYPSSTNDGFFALSGGAAALLTFEEVGRAQEPANIASMIGV